MNKIQIDWYNKTTKVRGSEIFEGQNLITLGRNSSSVTNDIGLEETNLSRKHAKIEYRAAQEIFELINITRQEETGTRVNGIQIKEPYELKNGSTFEIGPYIFTVTLFKVSNDEQYEDLEATDVGGQVFEDLEFTEREVDYEDEIKAKGKKAHLAFFNKSHVTIQDIRQSGLPVTESVYLAIGGGIGSFVWVDHLRIYGVPTHQIQVLGLNERPFAKYERLCAYSQIPHHERLRSNSESCPDNIWGFPGYALRECWKDKKIGSLLQVFGEPAMAETYTPRAGDVFQSVEEEANRIGWREMYSFGKVTAIRKTDDNRYVIAYKKSAKESSGERNCLAIAKYVHLCTGYVGTRLLSDLQEYRKQYGDFKRVVNAYEKHDQIYKDLEENGGIVVIRGRGIVASRIIQRIFEARKRSQQDINILHLMRGEKLKGSKYGSSRRVVQHHWEFQPFNWNKACWGGELRQVLENASDEERSTLIKTWGGTTTADRKDWMQIIDKGLKEDWYNIYFGSVIGVVPDGKGKIATKIKLSNNLVEKAQLSADYIIDCTGLINDVNEDPLLNDFINHNQLEQNLVFQDSKISNRGIKVSNDFEVTGMRNNDGRFYAAGSITFNGPYAPVDSFLGLQYCAQRSVEHLISCRAESIRLLSPLRSFRQWLKWVNNEKPN